MQPLGAICRIFCVYRRRSLLLRIRIPPNPPESPRRSSEAQSRSAMLHHQDQPLNSSYGGKGGSSNGSSSSLRNRKCDKDGNFNFLPGKDDEGTGGGGGGGGGGDENRNPVRPRYLGPLGRDPPNSKSPSGYHHYSGVLSRAPAGPAGAAWSPCRKSRAEMTVTAECLPTEPRKAGCRRRRGGG
uniref:Uncharacterized protein n=1 Tax=Gasterosteus aculeatus TaxID=69293 RepID=G3NDV0_GASAC